MRLHPVVCLINSILSVKDEPDSRLEEEKEDLELPELLGSGNIL